MRRRCFAVSNIGRRFTECSQVVCRSRRNSKRKRRRYCETISIESIRGSAHFRESSKDSSLMFFWSSVTTKPKYSLFTCAEVHGSINIVLIGEPEEENHITLRCDSALARHILDELTRDGFDVL